MLRSRIVQESIRRSSQELRERERGVGSGPVELSAHRALENLPQVNRLPYLPDSTYLQQDNGVFVFLPGYDS